MENASKALIIAGAILIAILLISVGIMVMNSTSGVQEGMQQQMDTTAIQQFNAKFDTYVGSGQTSTTVKSLISTIIANNGSAGDNRKIYVKYTDKNSGSITTYTQEGSLISGITANIDNQHTYTIRFLYDSTAGSGTAGYYNACLITEN